jgi:hypothetical protein
MNTRIRRPHGELKTVVRAYLAGIEDNTASIPEIQKATAPALDNPPSSSYRSALQDERYFVRVSRGVFRLTPSGAPVQQQ